MTGTGRSLLAAWLAAVVAAPVGGVAGGMLCALITAVVAGVPESGPDSPAGLAATVLSVGLWPLAAVVPAVLVGVHLAARGLPKARYGMLLGWSGFAAAGALPYLTVPGYDALPLGLVSGMASAWAFAQAGGRVRDASPVDAAA